jgi:putative transposase
MPFKTTIFSQLLAPIPRSIFQQYVEQYRGDKYSKSLSCWNQFVAMLYFQLTGKRSLRELSEGFNSHQNAHYHLGCQRLKRSTLADANDKRDHRIYRDLLNMLMKSAARQFRKTLAQAIQILDSTYISLGESLHRWAAQGHRVYGIKAHVAYSLEAEVPVHFDITHANLNDPLLFDELSITPGTLYLFDRGYYDFAGWKKMLIKKADFITRAKSSLAFRSIKSLPSNSPHIISDDYIQMTSKSGVKILKNKILRLVIARDHENRLIRLITSKLHEPATKIVDLYRQRWAIEIFFKWIKQNLKVKRFIGRSENAVKTQLFIAIIAFLLLRVWHLVSQSPLDLRYLASTLTDNLMKKSELKAAGPPGGVNPLLSMEIL